MCEYGAVVLFIHSTKQNLHIRYAPALCGLGPLPGLLTKHAHSSCGNEQPRRCCLHIPHTRPATNTRTRIHNTPVRHADHTPQHTGTGCPSFSPLQLSHGLLSHPLSITTTIRTHDTRTPTQAAFFAPARPLFSPCSHSLVRSSFPLLLCKTSKQADNCHYSLFPIVSMYTLLLFLSFVVSFSRREPPPPLTTSASPPSPPQTSASPPSPPPPP